jgi:hypothetical protein
MTSPHDIFIVAQFLDGIGAKQLSLSRCHVNPCQPNHSQMFLSFFLHYQDISLVSTGLLLCLILLLYAYSQTLPPCLGISHSQIQLNNRSKTFKKKVQKFPKSKPWIFCVPSATLNPCEWSDVNTPIVATDPPLPLALVRALLLGSSFMYCVVRSIVVVLDRYRLLSLSLSLKQCSITSIYIVLGIIST